MKRLGFIFKKMLSYAWAYIQASVVLGGYLSEIKSTIHCKMTRG